jgi:hypothetical protein
MGASGAQHFLKLVRWREQLGGSGMGEPRGGGVGGPGAAHAGERGGPIKPNSPTSSAMTIEK